MNQTSHESAKQPTLYARASELEGLINELRGDVNGLEDAANRLLGTEPQCGEKAQEPPAPDSFDATLNVHLNELRELSDRVRSLNQRLSEAV